jgi:thioredoxin reductase (NADPH)
MSEEYQLIIVGAGPIGLAAACAAQDAGLKYLILDKAGACQTITEFAPRQSFYSPAEELEVGGVPFPIAADDKPRREDALAYYRAVVASRKLSIHTWERVQTVHRVGEGFAVQPDEAWTREYRAQSVILASGVWDQPLALTVPGADLKKVSRRYVDPTPYYGKECLVVGGGNSAAEVAMSLARAGAKTRMALLEASFDDCRLRPFVLRELMILVDENKIAPEFRTEVTEITPTEVCLRHEDREWTVANDFLFTMIGAVPDEAFLRDAGVEIDPDDHKPVYDRDTFETNVPGLSVIGSMARDQHIVNGRAKAVDVVRRLANEMQKENDG